MPRPRKPWFREARNAWYVEIGGKQHRLADGPKNDVTEARAELEFHRLMAETMANPPADGGDPTVAALIDEYLEQNKKHLAPSTFYENRILLQKFCKKHGPRLVRNCIPYHLSKWVNDQETWTSNWTRSFAIRIVKRSFNWAVEQGLIEENPFLKVKPPKCKSRRRPIKLEEFTQLLTAAGRTSRLGETLLFLAYTGCRPCELRNLRWSDIHLDEPNPEIVIEEHKTSNTQDDPEPRVIPIVDELAILLASIADRCENSEFVFVTHRRTPWARSSLQQSVRRLRRKIGLSEDVILYGIRHFVGTQSVRNGNDVRTTADILGHTGTRTTDRYIHPSNDRAHLAAAMARATSSLRCA